MRTPATDSDCHEFLTLDEFVRLPDDETRKELVRGRVAAGTRMVWIIEPRRRTVMVYRSRDDIRLLTEEDALAGGDVLPGFRLLVAELFAG